VKMANTDEVTETVEITEVVDEEQQVSNEVRFSFLFSSVSNLNTT
jgi:hypothetical protein